MGIFNPQIISRTQPLVIVSDLAKFKPLPLSDIKNGRNDRTRTCNLLAPNQAVYYWHYIPIKLAGDKGIEPLQEDSKSSALPLCKSPVLKVERVEGIEPSHGLWKSPRLPLHHTRFKMAEREGFEPSVAFKDHNSLANCLFRPLRHPSIKSLTISDFFTGRYYQSSAPLSSGVVLKWRLMSVLPGPSSFNEPSFQD